MGKALRVVVITSIGAGGLMWSTSQLSVYQESYWPFIAALIVSVLILLYALYFGRPSSSRTDP